VIMATAERFHQSEQVGAINPRWVRFILRDRGIPCPSLPVLDASIKALHDGEREAFRSRISRMQMGVESTDDASHVRTFLDGAMRSATWVNAPTAVSTSVSDNSDEHPPVPAKPLSPATREMSPSELRRFERSHHVYAGKGAATFEPVEVSPERPGQDTWYSIQIEMAKAISARRYDWDHKIAFRLTLRELPVFASVLLGHSPFLIAGNHGPGNDKFLEMRDQSEEGTIMIVLKQGKRVVAVPIQAEEVFTLGSMAFKALQRNAPHLDSAAISELVERAGRMYSRAIGCKQ
jgi:hypothetical protein